MYVNATRTTMDNYETRILVYRWTCVSNIITHRLMAIMEHMLAFIYICRSPFLFVIFDCNPSIQVGEARTQSPVWLWLLVPAPTQDDDKLFLGSTFGIHKGFQSKSCSRWPIWTAFICLWLARGDFEADPQFGEYRSNPPWGMIYKSLAVLGIETPILLHALSGISLRWMVGSLVGFGLFL